MKKYALKLYITGETRHSQKAIANLKIIQEQMLNYDCEVEILDVLNQPEQADLDKILATPTLIRLRPLPIRRMIGDLSNLQAVKAVLGLEPDHNSHPHGA